MRSSNASIACGCVACALLASVTFPTTANAAGVINVNQVNLTFSPSTVEAAPGDTIKWNWSSLSHTVTSGTNCTADGLFNFPLTAANPMPMWTVPADARGEINYFCIPHCGFQMKGKIVVVPPPPPSPDLDGDGCVGAPDLAILLGGWGSRGPTDLDQSGTTDAGDLAILLGAWDC